MKQTFAERTAAVLSGYSFRLVARGVVTNTGAAVRSYRVTNEKDPRRSYVVTVGSVNGCSCPAFQRDGRTCKHLTALSSLVPAVTLPAPSSAVPTEWDPALDDLIEENTLAAIRPTLDTMGRQEDSGW